MVLVHDPEMRQRFDGHKAAVVGDTDAQLITAMDVLPGNALDNLGALEFMEQSEASAGVPVVEATGNTAYRDGGTRQAFVDAGRKPVARVPGRPNRKHFPKEHFAIDLVAGTCTCPARQVTGAIVPAGKRTDSTGTAHRLQAFRFDGAVCQGCLYGPRALRPGAGRDGRRSSTHRKPCFRKPGRYNRAPTMTSTGDAGWWPSIDWLGWNSWASGRRATSDGSRPSSSCTWRPRWPI